MARNARTAPRRPDLSVAILVIGAVAYAVLCQPAIARRGYPPIDDLWMGMTYLWVFPPALSALFDGGRFRSRQWHLFAYAVFTGSIDSATVGFIVPRQVSLVGALVFTVFFFGPLHLAITFAIEAAMQWMLGRWRTFSSDEATTTWLPRLTLIEYLIAYTIVAMMIGFPFAYRNWSIQSERVGGRRLAEDHWAAQRPYKFVDSPQMPEFTFKGVEAYCAFDRTTGFELHWGSFTTDTKAAYNERIVELVKDQGLPAWSAQSQLISPDELIALLDRPLGREVVDLPSDVTPSITVFRRGTISKWGSTMTANTGGAGVTSSGSSPAGIYISGNGMAIATQADGLRVVSSGTLPIFVIEQSPDTVCIRHGNDWIGLFHRDGRLLQTAHR